MDHQGRLRDAGLRGAGLTLALLLAVAAIGMTLAASASAASFGAAAWGYNSSGQLGNGTTLSSDVPVPVSGLSGVSAISAGGEHSLALLSNGTVMAWGNNRKGQLGNGTTVNSDVPVAVKGLTGVIAISAGGHHSLALLSNGTVRAWGANEGGQLGNGTTVSSDVPVAVKEAGGKELSGVSAISAGGEHSLALLSKGTVMAWGANEEGQLGDGKTTKSDVPVAVKGLTGASAISAGGEHSLALLSKGTVMAWGSNVAGQLGDGSEQERSDVPVAVEGISGVSAISAGGEHSLALLSNGTVMAWGSDLVGQLGDGSFGASSNTPVAVSELSGVSAISAGARHSLALLGTGTIVAWGYNPDGQLGDGGVTNSDLPVAVSGLAEVAGISAGGSSSLSYGAPAPAVASVEPNTGPASGGTTVTITGTNFTGATAVRFGSIAAASFTVNSSTSITAVTPPEASGKVNLFITTPDGTNAISRPDHFKFEAPTITNVNPNTGPITGGTSVTITGTGFALGTSATTIKFGGTLATSVDCTSTTTCVVVAPAAEKARIVEVRATVSGLTSPKNPPADQFTYS